MGFNETAEVFITCYSKQFFLWFQVLLFSSTFSSQLTFTLGLPLLLIVPESCQFLYQVLRSSGEMARTGKGEIALVQQQEDTIKKLKHLFMTYLLAHLVKVMQLSMHSSVLAGD